jgi:hypothetical protein
MFRTIVAMAVLTTGAVLGSASGAQAQSLVPCAREHGFCRVPYPTRVVYGIPGRSTEVFVREGGVPCSNRVFGDPAPGVPKRCAYIARRYDRGDRWRDDGYRGPPPPRGYERGYDRGYDRDDRGYDDGYERPQRRYEVY